MPAVFVYGTLRPGSWNHDRWLAPWLAGPCRPASLRGPRLHHLGGLPYLVASGDDADVVMGAVADLDPDLVGDALVELDVLEDTDGGHYVRVQVDLVGGERAWTYVAGPLVADALDASTAVQHGDFLRIPR